MSLAILLYSLTSVSTPSVSPPSSAGIEILSVPSFGTSGFLFGETTGVDPSDHEVATYLLVEGLGWFNKPFANQKTVSIDPDGSFSVDVDTGGLDPYATHYCVALVPKGSVPPSASGSSSLPSSSDFLATDCEERYGRTLEFAGRTWGVKESPLPVGPGPNRFSGHPDDVFVDAEGKLHLSIRFRDGHWWSTEVVLLESLGHGQYSFVTESELDRLDAHAVFAGFTWDNYGSVLVVTGNPNREMDFEDSRWGDPQSPTSSQVVVQPYGVPGNLVRYDLPDLSQDPRVTRFLTWRADSVEFAVFHRLNSPSLVAGAEQVFRHRYRDDPSVQHYVPVPGNERWRFNLWLNHPSGPTDGEDIEVIVSDFRYL